MLCVNARNATATMQSQNLTCNTMPTKEEKKTATCKEMNERKKKEKKKKFKHVI